MSMTRSDVDAFIKARSPLFVHVFKSSNDFRKALTHLYFHKPGSHSWEIKMSDGAYGLTMKRDGIYGTLEEEGCWAILFEEAASFPEYSTIDPKDVFNAKLNGGFDHVPCCAPERACAFETCICRRPNW